MRYIKGFETESAYNAYKQGATFITPNISAIIGSNKIYYNPPVADIYNGHPYVDLGLPSGTKWATMNVGASNIEDYGNYYQYGKGTSQYSETYQDEIYHGTEIPLSLEYDTAAQVMGGEWHMPTQAQFQELLDNCTWEWTTLNEINGYTISNNGNSIFLPASGAADPSVERYNAGTEGNYWTSTTINEWDARSLWFKSDLKIISNPEHSAGYTIRGVVG